MPKVKRSKRIAERRHQKKQDEGQSIEIHQVDQNRGDPTGQGAGDVSTASHSAEQPMVIDETANEMHDEAGETPKMVESYQNTMGLNVSSEMKNKITNGQYVDLKKMFMNKNEVKKQKIIVVNGELQTTEKETKQINDVETWTDAFLIYASIYLTAHPSKNLEILKYLKDIRLAAARSNSGFLEYDQQFRLRMAQNPSKSWAEVDSELWLLYIVPNNKQLTAAELNQSQTKKCYSYNYKGSCFKSPCIYLHACIRCNKSHPEMYCPNRQIRTDSSNFRGQYRGHRGSYQNTRGSTRNQYRGARGGY